MHIYEFGPNIDVWQKTVNSIDHCGDKLHDFIYFSNNNVHSIYCSYLMCFVFAYKLCIDMICR